MRLTPIALLPALLGCACEQESRAAPTPDGDRTAERHAMVREQLEARGIEDPRVLDAMRAVPRHRFVPEDQRPYAYDNGALPIGHGQTISQPYVVAFMSQALDVEPGNKVFEVGTGSGYQAAVLAEMGAEVHSIEIVEPLAERARTTLAELGYDVAVRTGDGYRGWPEHAPFDAIIVTCAPDHVPQPLVDQLAVGGRMMIPVGDVAQELILLERTPEGLERSAQLPVRFVPMTGEARDR